MPSTQDILTSLLTPGIKAWSGPTLTYSLPGAASVWTGYAAGSEPFSAGYAPLSVAQAAILRAAIAAWDRVVAIDFVEVTEPLAIGDVRIAFTTGVGNFATAGAWAYVPSANGTAPNGDIWVNATYGLDSVTYTMLVHELGHVLGLKHINEPGTPLPAEYRGDAYSFMAATGSTLIVVTPNANNPNLASVSYQPLFPKGPGIYDIFVVQSLYGVEPDTGAGDTIYAWRDGDTPADTIYDAGGVDTFDASGMSRASIIDLTPGATSSIGKFTLAEQTKYWTDLYPNLVSVFPASHPNAYAWTNNVGIAFSTVIENAIGGRSGDTITGNAAANRITGNGGDDIIDGGEGVDVALFSGKASEYTWSKSGDGQWTVVDLTSGRDGIDKLKGVEILQFTDRALVLQTSFSAAIESAFLAVLRTNSAASVNATFASELQLKLYANLGEAGAVAEIVHTAVATTSVATLAYEFFTGKIPTQIGVDFLVSPSGPNNANLNSNYYDQFNVVNRYINFAVNLGKNGEAKDSFTAKYGSLSLFDATKEAYKNIFGATPTDAKVHSLIDGRIDYLAYYGGDGANGIGTKAAMVGFLLAAAATEDVGVMARSNDAWLTDLSDGSAPFAIDVLDPAKGYWKADFIFGGA